MAQVRTLTNKEDRIRLTPGNTEARDAPAIRQQLERYAQDEYTTISEAMRAAVREFLRARGYWPPPEQPSGGS